MWIGKFGDGVGVETSDLDKMLELNIRTLKEDDVDRLVTLC